jgi:DNA-binding SARP family transcriptional activator
MVAKSRSLPTSSARRFQLSLLGAFELRGAQTIAIATKKNRALLAILALSPKGSATREQICGLLWGDREEKLARSNLRQSLVVLRREFRTKFDEILFTKDDVIGLKLDNLDVDVLRLRALNKTADISEAAEVASLCRGPLLADLSIREPGFDEWLDRERRAILESALALFDRLSNSASGAERIGYAKRLVDLDPLRESSHRSLMLAYSDANESSMALRQFNVCVKILKDELGVHPAQPTLDLHEQIVSQSRPARAARIGSEEGALASNGMRFSGRSRAAIAILPLENGGGEGSHDQAWARGFLQDVCYKLAKLKSVDVISADSTSALAGTSMSPADIGALLKVDYLCFGHAIRSDGRLRVDVRLVACDDARIIWSDRYEDDGVAVFAMIDWVTDGVVAQLSSQIELEERKRAVLKFPASMDAWDAYHRGLWHMFRFRKADNELAARYFTMSRERDPTFSRAYAGLSFTHWIDAYVFNLDNRREHCQLALRAAFEAVAADGHDPAAHCAVGRALWINGSTNEALEALMSAVRLSPGHAFGHYSAGMISCQSGDPDFAIAAFDRATELSPLDPFQGAFMASRGLAYLRKGAFEEAARWAEKSILQSNAHIHVKGVAALCLAADGQIDKARGLVAAIRQIHPGYGGQGQLAAMQLPPDDLRLLTSLAKAIGIG